MTPFVVLFIDLYSERENRLFSLTEFINCFSFQIPIYFVAPSSILASCHLLSCSSVPHFWDNK